MSFSVKCAYVIGVEPRRNEIAAPPGVSFGLHIIQPDV